MNCIKCGREMFDGVFCPDCLADMERYPVKPGTVVQLPRRDHSSAARKPYPRKRALPLEEQILILKKRIRTLSVLLILAVALTAALIYPAVSYILDGNALLPGQNYTAIIPTTEGTEAATEPLVIPPWTEGESLPEETV